MTAARRTFGRPATLRETLVAGKVFTDTAMELEIEDLIHESRYMRHIGRTAADLSGVRLQREGDSTSKRIVFAAYDTLYDLMRPSLLEYGADDTQRLFMTNTTRSTLLNLSSNISSYGFSKIAVEYSRQNNYLHMTGDGLEIDSRINFPQKFESNRGGCPYAKTHTAAYFNRFTDRIVETYAEAHRRGMPHGWLETTSRFLLKR